MKRFRSLAMVVVLLLVISWIPLGDGKVALADGEVAINVQNFPDDQFRATISDYYDDDDNGYLSLAERNNVTSTIWFHYGIKDFSGIEYFPELKEFNYHGSPDSHEEFTSLDLSHNNKLEIVDVMYGSIKQLTLGSQPYLHHLFIQGNPIDRIDVSGCRYLVFANAMNNAGYSCYREFYHYNYEGEPTGHYFLLNLSNYVGQIYSEDSTSSFMNTLRGLGYSYQYYTELYNSINMKPSSYADGFEKYIDFEFYDSCSVYYDPGTMPPYDNNMYRLYNSNSGEHFYTSNISERNYLISLGWSYEGTGWYAPASSGTPVFRLYNQNGGEHHYTTSVLERDMLISVGWSYEGIGWYSDDAQTVPLYRQYNPNAFANNHNYTTSLTENDWLVSIGWQAEGVGWYGVG